MKNFNKHYQQSTKVPKPKELTPETDAEKAEAKRKKHHEELEFSIWLESPCTLRVLNIINEQEVILFQEAKALADYNHLENTAASKKLVELDAIDKLRNLILKGSYARSNS